MDHQQEQSATEPSPRSRAVYLFLTAGLGFTGVNDLYIGRYFQGLARPILIAATLGLFAPLAVLWNIIQFFAVKTDGRGRTLRPAGSRISALAGCLFFVLIFGALVLIMSPLEKARSELCAKRLYEVGILLHHYAADYSGSLPPGNWTEVLGPYGDLDDLRCPNTVDMAKGELGFAYFGSGLNLDDLPPDTPIAMDRRQKPHRNSSVNVLRVNGVVFACVPADLGSYEAILDEILDGAIPDAVRENARLIDKTETPVESKPRGLLGFRL